MTLREKVLLILREYDKDQNLTDPDTTDRILALVAEDRRELVEALKKARWHVAQNELLEADKVIFAALVKMEEG